MSAFHLVRVGDTDLTAHHPDEDIRGRWVIDGHGEEIGYIDALLIDARERKVRFLQIASTSDVGGGEQRYLLPANAIAGITDDEVMVNQTREHITNAPKYDPNLTYDQEYYGEVCAHYEYPPYWSASDT